MPELPAPSGKEDLNRTKFRPFPFSPALEDLTPHPEDLELPPPVDEHDDGDRPRAMIGTTGGTEVWFDPDYPKQRLANAHISITGQSGSGKSQSMKTIIADLWAQGVPALILDFKDDYADPKYAAEGRFTVYDPTKEPLPINPLTPPSDPQTRQVNVIFHAYQVAEIISRIYGLGEIQAFRLREAIKEVFKDAGLPITPFVPGGDQKWPLFQSVREKLATSKDNNELLGHLSPIFDFGFFSSTDAKGFAGIAERNTVIRLGQLPGNEIKNTVAEFFLMSMYNHLISMPQMHVLDRILILDEAWRLVNSPFLEPLMREGRAFGLGIFVATQFPTDLPLAVSGSTATQMFFSQTSPSQITEIKRIVAGNTSSTVADQLDRIIRAMPPMTCVLHNKQYPPFARVEARPYYLRKQINKVASEEPLDWVKGNRLLHLDIGGTTWCGMATPDGSRYNNSYIKSLPQVRKDTLHRQGVCKSCSYGWITHSPRSDLRDKEVTAGGAIACNCQNDGGNCPNPALFESGLCEYCHNGHVWPWEERKLDKAASFICTHCQTSTDQPNHLCKACGNVMDEYTGISSDTQDDLGIDNAVGSGAAGQYASRLINQVGGWKRTDKEEISVCDQCEGTGRAGITYSGSLDVCEDCQHLAHGGSRCPGSANCGCDLSDQTFSCDTCDGAGIIMDTRGLDWPAINGNSGPNPVKKAELEPFPPGKEIEGDPFSIIQERFVESPKNKRPT